MSDHDWRIEQGTVDFRNEERRHAHQVRREESPGLAATAPATGLTAPPAERLCPNCLVELDEASFCWMCGRMETSRAPERAR